LVEIPSGYRGKTLEILREANAKIGDQVRITKNGNEYEGILMPRTELGDPNHIVIKLKNGYNIGVKITSNFKLEVIGVGSKPSFKPPPQPSEKPHLPKVSIISTGGTIASRVDYRTGAVFPALSADDLYSVVPELSNIARIKAEILYSLLSENITPNHWTTMAKATVKQIEEGVSGVVIAHGTDTMGYTAAALSFALQNLPIPIILTGSQRSSDRPSSDAATNLMGAVIAATNAPFAEVAVAMHGQISDEIIVLHRGTKVRKCNTSRRDAFKSVNSKPLGHVVNGKVIMTTSEYKLRDQSRKPNVKPNFSDRVALVKFYPGINPEIFDWLVDRKFLGIVLEGSGLGHIGRYCFNAIKQAVDRGLIVAMSSQCIWGRVRMTVYDTGRDLLALGVIPLEDMLPETALVKMMWAFGQTTDTEEVKKIMLTNIAGEFSPRTLLEG
jgi:glutamyl-tRNA(Gln) amidotransferase subunit D